MKMVTIRAAQTNLSRLIEKSLSRRRDHYHARARTQSRVWFRSRTGRAAGSWAFSWGKLGVGREFSEPLAPEELEGWDSIG
ncbi:MAG TPA: hypothetical protein VMQ17_15230 [Candidatus Sulfotelmatobacter sp.]|nr:hypothetical protein [Candidatus Sulfotelmatobacter sp.]